MNPTEGLGSPLRQPCGAVPKNRRAQAAMTEGLADPMNAASVTTKSRPLEALAACEQNETATLERWGCPA